MSQYLQSQKGLQPTFLKGSKCLRFQKGIQSAIPINLQSAIPKCSQSTIKRAYILPPQKGLYICHLKRALILLSKMGLHILYPKMASSLPFQKDLQSIIQNEPARLPSKKGLYSSMPIGPLYLPSEMGINSEILNKSQYLVFHNGFQSAIPKGSAVYLLKKASRQPSQKGLQSSILKARAVYQFRITFTSTTLNMPSCLPSQKNLNVDYPKTFSISAIPKWPQSYHPIRLHTNDPSLALVDYSIVYSQSLLFTHLTNLIQVKNLLW